MNTEDWAIDLSELWKWCLEEDGIQCFRIPDCGEENDLSVGDSKGGYVKYCDQSSYYEKRIEPCNSYAASELGYESRKWRHFKKVMKVLENHAKEWEAKHAQQRDRRLELSEYIAERKEILDEALKKLTARQSLRTDYYEDMVARVAVSLPALAQAISATASDLEVPALPKAMVSLDGYFDAFEAYERSAGELSTAEKSLADLDGQVIDLALQILSNFVYALGCISYCYIDEKVYGYCVNTSYIDFSIEEGIENHRAAMAKVEDFQRQLGKWKNLAGEEVMTLIEPHFERLFRRFP